MATVDETTVSPRQLHHQRRAHLQPISPRVPVSIERQFEQYLIDHHHYPKLPSITKPNNRQSTQNVLVNEEELAFNIHQRAPLEHENNTGPISRLLNSDQYRRAQTRLIEYRQHSKIPGITITATKNSKGASSLQLTGKNEITIPIKEVLSEATKGKHYQQDEFDFVDDDSVMSNDTDRRRRAKHWIKEHQFFFTEYQ